MTTCNDSETRPCACCSSAIDIELIKDNPLCDRCQQEAYVRQWFFDIEREVAAQKLPFKLSISVKYQVTQSISGPPTPECGYVVSFTNMDAQIVVIGIGRTLEEASRKGLQELREAYAKARSMYGTAA